MASSRFFPSRVQSLIREGKFLSCQFAPQGSSAPTLTSQEGVASVARNSAGNFTITLADQWRALIDAQCSLQLAAPAANVLASYTWTDSTDSDSVTFQAGPGFPGTLGNNLKVVVATGSGLANSISYSGGITTVTITINTGTTTPALLATYVNTTAASTLGGIITISAHTGTTAFTVFLSSTALTGGSSAALDVQFGAIDVVTNKTVVIEVFDANTGSGADISANAGNLVNVNLFLKAE